MAVIGRKRATRRIAAAGCVGIVLALLTVAMPSPALAVNISGAVGSTVRVSSVADGANPPAAEVQAVTNLSVTATSPFTGSIPGSVAITAETAPEPPVYRDEAGDRLRRADFRSLNLTATVNPAPATSVTADYTLRSLAESAAPLDVPYTQKSAGLGFAIATPKLPAWSGEIRSDRVVDAIDGSRRNTQTNQTRLQGSYNTEPFSYSFLASQDAYADYTGLYSDYTTSNVQGSVRLNPTSHLTLLGSYQKQLSQMEQTLAYQENGSLNAALVVAPRVQLRGTLLDAGFSSPEDGAVLTRTGSGVDYDSPWKLRISGDLDREIRWNAWTGQAEVHDMREAKVMKALGKSTVSLRRGWDEMQGTEWSQDTVGADLDWPLSAHLTARVSVDNVATRAAETAPTTTEILVYPELAYQHDVAKGVSVGVDGRTTIALADGSSQSRDVNESVYARGQLGNGFQLDLNLGVDGSRQTDQSWVFNRNLAASLSRSTKSGAQQSLTYHLGRVILVGDLVVDAGDGTLDTGDREANSEDMQFMWAVPFGRATWTTQWQWNRLTDTVDPGARRHWWTVGTGLTWRF